MAVSIVPQLDINFQKIYRYVPGRFKKDLLLVTHTPVLNEIWEVVDNPFKPTTELHLELGLSSYYVIPLQFVFVLCFLFRLFSGTTFGTIFLREKSTSNNNDSHKTIATDRSSRYFSSIGNWHDIEGIRNY